MESEFALNPLMTLAGLVLIPVLIWFLKQKQTKNTILLGVLFLLVFSGGTLELIGIPTSVHRLLLELLAFAVFYKGVLVRSKKQKQMPGMIWFVMFILFSILSVVLNNLSIPLLLLFFRDYLMLFLFFYGVYNLHFSSHETNTITKLIIYLFISQIFANVIKYIIMQTVMEPYIGTMANLGGSLTIIFSLIGAAYTIANYFITKHKKYLWWTLGFVLFSFLGHKRAIIVYLPMLFFILMFAHQRISGSNLFKSIKRLLFFSSLSVILFYFSVRTMPSLNPEGKVWGSFNVEFALDYSERYVTTGAGSEEVIGRAQAPAYLFAMMLADNPYHFLMGYGAGHLVKSGFNADVKRLGSQSDLTENLYGVGYGARTAMLQLLLQVGLSGLVCYLILLVNIFRKTKTQFIRNLKFKQNTIYYLFFISLWLVFCLDFFTYSVTVIQLSAVAMVMFWFVGVKNIVTK